MRMRSLLVPTAVILLASSCDTGETPLENLTEAPQASIGVVPMGTVADPCPNCDGVSISGAAYSWDSCVVYAVQDYDGDTVDDRCERDLAEAFAPMLITSPDDDDLSRESYWMAQISTAPGLTNAINIFYLLGYHMDTGVAYQHEGDSEFIELFVVWDSQATTGGTPGRWKLYGATLSAHYLSPADRTNFYTYNQLEFPAGNYLDNPKIWVAEDNHGNFPSKRACGPTFPSVWPPTDDTCKDNNQVEYVDVVYNRNIGSQWGQLLNCVLSTQQHLGYDGEECFWERGNSFAGWDASAPGTTGYGDILYNFSYFHGTEY